MEVKEPVRPLNTGEFLPDEASPKYRIEAILGKGGFAYTYLALNLSLDTRVAIKEYFPDWLAYRHSNTNRVRPKSREQTDLYGDCLQRFLREGRILAKFKHPNIVRIFDSFEAHGTAYLVMDFEEGETLADYLKRSPPPRPLEEILDCFLPLLDGLREVHKHGLLHLDIKPDNIFLRDEGAPALIDFGGARQFIGSHSKSVSSMVESAGYSPPEQYATEAIQGPWSDVYAVAASLYHCISGLDLPGGRDRGQALIDGEADPLRPAVEIGRGPYPASFLEAIDRGLVRTRKDRPQSAREFQKMLSRRSGPVPGPAPVNPIPDPPPPPWPWKGFAAWLLAGLLVAGVGIGVWKAGLHSRSSNEHRARPAAEDETRETIRLPQQREPGAVFRDALKDGSLGPEMVVIPAGRFRMGDLAGGGDSDEKPVREVRIAKAFALGRYEISNSEYRRCVNAGGCKPPEWLEAGSKYNIQTGSNGYYKKFTGDDQPAVGVNWNDAVAYAGWLKKVTGKPYRLPSEAEWEYAARAGGDTKYSWGDEIGRNRANCDGCAFPFDYDTSAPVGSFAENEFGLFDMHGNVWEWVEDCWHDNYNGAPGTAEAWTTDGDCSRRVVRGGSWGNEPGGLRSASRGGDTPANRNFNLGFRLSRM